MRDVEPLEVDAPMSPASAKTCLICLRGREATAHRARHYRHDAPVTPQTTVRFGLTVAFRQFSPW